MADKFWLEIKVHREEAKWGEGPVAEVKLDKQGGVWDVSSCGDQKWWGVGVLVAEALNLGERLLNASR